MQFSATILDVGVQLPYHDPPCTRPFCDVAPLRPVSKSPLPGRTCGWWAMAWMSDGPGHRGWFGWWETAAEGGAPCGFYMCLLGFSGSMALDPSLNMEPTLSRNILGGRAASHHGWDCQTITPSLSIFADPHIRPEPIATSTIPQASSSHLKLNFGKTEPKKEQKRDKKILSTTRMCVFQWFP